MPEVTIENMQEGIMALLGVRAYLQHIMNDDKHEWNGWNEVLATAVDVMLKYSLVELSERDPRALPELSGEEALEFLGDRAVQEFLGDRAAADKP
jgi:hypothetical protein